MGVRKLRLDIKVAGLVHIGNGQRYGKRDYFVHGGEIAVLDVRKFVSRLTPDQVSRYCDFLGNAYDKFGLQGFLTRRENADLLKIAQGSIAYRIDSPIATARRGAIQYHDVWQFVKDAHGNPYIPGSSIKGMLRTALLLNMVLDDAGLRAAARVDELAASKSCSANAGKSLNRVAFWKEQPNPSDPSVKNDIMRYVSVSDSEPLSVDSLVFAKKYDKFSKGDPVDHKLDMGKLTLKEGNELDVYRECLRPGTTVSVDVTVDERIDEYLASPVLDAQGLSNILQRAFDFYSERFLSHFESGEGEGSSASGSSDGGCQYIITAGPLAGMRCPNKAVGDTGFCNTHQDKAGQCAASAEVTCYLGGGVDFISKTVTSALFDDEADAVQMVSRILYNQFPTKIDRSIHPTLYSDVQRAGFSPKSFEARRQRPGGRITKAKEDHRHWRDQEIGVSPHTMKWGIVGKDRYPMGKCSITVREL